MKEWKKPLIEELSISDTECNWWRTPGQSSDCGYSATTYSCQGEGELTYTQNNRNRRNR